MCMRDVTQAHCDHIAHKLNSRPRKRHDYQTPRRVYDENSRSLHFNVEPKQPYDYYGTSSLTYGRLLSSTIFLTSLCNSSADSLTN
jgi:hypothetical protein